MAVDVAAMEDAAPDGAQSASMNSEALDSAIACLGVLSYAHDKPVDEARLRHEFAAGHTAQMPEADFRRALQTLGLKAELKRVGVRKLDQLNFPDVLLLKDGSYAVLGKLEDDQALIQRSLSQPPESISRDELSALWSGKVIRVAQCDGPEKSGGFAASGFYKVVWKYRSLLRDVLLASLFIQIFALISPMVFMVVVDKVLNHQNLSTLTVLVVALGVVSLFDVILSGLRTYLLSHTNHKVDAELSSRFVKHLLSLPVSFFESRTTGDILARIKELEGVRHFITGPALTALLDVLFVGVFLFVMFLFSPALTGIVALILPLFFLVSVIMTPLMRSKLDDKFRINSDNQAFLVETVSNIRSVKGMAAESAAQHRWESQLSQYINAAFQGSQYGNTVNQMVAFLSKASVVIVLYFGATMVLEGELTVGQLIAFNMLAARVNAPILRLAQIWQEAQQLKVSIQRLAEVMQMPSEPTFDPNRTPMPPMQGQIQFQNVGFRYHPDLPEAVSELNIAVKPGEVLGLMGESGSGKSTLIKLLRRFYAPQQGRILVDGADISRADGAWLRSQIGVVSTDDVLFNSRIIDNIRGGHVGLSAEECRRAAELAGVHGFVMGLPEGYDTVVGENGARLSAGQRQRILIARALAGDPRILVLDEATNFLDLPSERQINANLKRICQDRTVIIASHRHSILKYCQRIIEMEQGRIVNAGGLELIEIVAARMETQPLQGGVADERAVAV